jgi:rhodanese-related sulfurtransferase
VGQKQPQPQQLKDRPTTMKTAATTLVVMVGTFTAATAFASTTLPTANRPPVSNEKQREKCEQSVAKIRKLFPEVPLLTSEEFVALDSQNKNTRQQDIILVDVRSKAEREISTIEGSISVSELEDLLWRQHQQHQQQQSPPAGNDNMEEGKLPLQHIVTYCTIGFRACVHAKRLQEKLEKKRNEKKRNNRNKPIYLVSALDGIVPYTHIQDQKFTNKRPIVSLQTGQPTRKLHTYGEQWDLGRSEYESIVFSKPLFVAHSLAFGGQAAWAMLKDRRM